MDKLLRHSVRGLCYIVLIVVVDDVEIRTTTLSLVILGKANEPSAVEGPLFPPQFSGQATTPSSSQARPDLQLGSTYLPLCPAQEASAEACHRWRPQHASSQLHDK